LTQSTVDEPQQALPPVVTAEPTPSEPEWLTFTATAYVADCDGCIGITRTGIDVKHTQVDEEGRRIIAVDPDVIPLGTALDIRIGNEIIEAVAEDTGGSIDGREIDVLMATEAEAIEFGRRDVQIRIKGAD
jgi:3D (Asp-Asp-Asp) domain-containing protein